jgi:coenzyme F420-0:L-glutamate ligase/coenzyme F420-1:gamma-L-glutamate ligase
MPPTITLIGIEGLPDFTQGDDVARLTVEAALRQGTPLAAGDVVIVTQKVISKAEGRLVNLAEVEPSAMASSFAAAWDKDARVVEVALREAKRIIRMDNGVLITETRHGFRCANSGVDASNVGPAGDDTVALLPLDPDASARTFRQGVRDTAGVDVAVVVSDTFGRPWREGAENVAVGVAGLEPLWDYRGTVDIYGRELLSTTIAIADELAAAAELVTGKVARVPVAIIRGYVYQPGESGVAPLIRDAATDLFR